MSEGIVYQNKDVEFKMISETFKEKSFAAYGLDLPKIKAVLPTNLPAVFANEMRIDNVFLLEDDSVAIVDYESEDKVSNRIKYVNYIGRFLQRYYQDEKKIPDMRMIVIYTGDVQRAEASFETKCLTLSMEQVFISKLPEEEIYQSIKSKLENNETLSDTELMQLIILPLTGKGKEAKQQIIQNVITLTKQIKDETKQVFVLSGVLVATDKFIDEKYADNIRRYLSMTKVARLYEEEKLEAVNLARKDERRETRLEMIESFIKAGTDTLTLMEATGLTREELEEIKNNMLMTK